MYCAKCGTTHDAATTHCSRCGEALGRPVAPLEQQVPSHLAPAILVTLFCCMPFGIVAIVYAAQAMSKSGAGDYAGAVAMSRAARTWCWLSFALGLITCLAFGLMELLFLMATGVAAACGAH